jgi:outer membrane protein TolC
MRRIALIVAMPICLLASAAQAELRLQEVIESSYTHYPKIIEAQEKIIAQQGKLQKAQGAFDWEFNHKSGNRLRGYYDGAYAENTITRRLSDSATRLYGGYRFSDGYFPVYEQERATLSAGEVHAGLIISLWRDRIIDEERFAYADAELELKQQEFELLLTKLGVQYDAMIAYIDWVSAGLAQRVVKAQLELAQKRQEAFEQRIKKGDLAQIYLTENQQTLLKRQAELTETERKLVEAANKLSLYLRDADGNPVVVKEQDLPQAMPEPKTVVYQSLDVEIERARNLRPELIAMSLETERKQRALALGENQTLPKVDFYMEGAKDMGSGLDSMRPAEAKIGLNISIPLQQNLGQGMMKQTQSELRQIEQRRRLLNDQISAEIQTVANNYHAARQYAEYAQKETEAAEAMRRAENLRFAEGAADFFLLNMREDRLAEAQMRHINANNKLWLSIAGFYLATLKMDELRTSLHKH